jgi:hypothetical protein
MPCITEDFCRVGKSLIFEMQRSEVKDEGGYWTGLNQKSSSGRQP